MTKKIFKILLGNKIVLLFILLFLVEFLVTIYLDRVESVKTRLVGFYKIFFQIIILLSINFKNLNKKILYLFISLSLLFCLNQLLNPLLFNDFNLMILKGSIYHYDRYIFIILFVLMILSRKDKNKIVQKSIKIVEYILIANLILIVIGFLFKLDLFKSYVRSPRFGYDGLFNKVNEVSYIYSIYLIYLYYKSAVLKSQNWFLFFIVSVVSLLIGTKVLLLFLSLLFVFHFTIVYNKNVIIKTLAIALILTFIIFFKKITQFVFDLFPFWEGLKQEYDLITLLLSKRDYLFYNALDYMTSNWSFINYLIGGTYYSNSFALTQMDGPDLFLFFGAIGSIIYLNIFGLIFIKKTNIYLNVLTIIIMICGLLGGGLLISPLCMILLFLVTYNLEQKYRFKFN